MVFENPNGIIMSGYNQTSNYGATDIDISHENEKQNDDIIIPNRRTRWLHIYAAFFVCIFVSALFFVTSIQSKKIIQQKMELPTMDDNFIAMEDIGSIETNQLFLQSTTMGNDAEYIGSIESSQVAVLGDALDPIESAGKFLLNLINESPGDALALFESSVQSFLDTYTCINGNECDRAAVIEKFLDIGVTLIPALLFIPVAGQGIAISFVVAKAFMILYKTVETKYDDLNTYVDRKIDALRHDIDWDILHKDLNHFRTELTNSHVNATRMELIELIGSVNETIPKYKQRVIDLVYVGLHASVQKQIKKMYENLVGGPSPNWRQKILDDGGPIFKDCAKCGKVNITKKVKRAVSSAEDCSSKLDLATKKANIFQTALETMLEIVTIYLYQDMVPYRQYLILTNNTLMRTQFNDWEKSTKEVMKKLEVGRDWMKSKCGQISGNNLTPIFDGHVLGQVCNTENNGFCNYPYLIGRCSHEKLDPSHFPGAVNLNPDSTKPEKVIRTCKNYRDHYTAEGLGSEGMFKARHKRLRLAKDCDNMFLGKRVRRCRDPFYGSHTYLYAFPDFCVKRECIDVFTNVKWWNNMSNFKSP